MIDLASIRTRLGLLDLFNTITDAASVTAALEKPARPPSAYVVTANERATPNRTQGVHDQKVQATVAVIMQIAAQRADAGQADRVETLREAVINQLTGWTATGAKDPFDYSGYQIVRMAEGLIWVQCNFQTVWILRTS